MSSIDLIRILGSVVMAAALFGSPVAAEDESFCMKWGRFSSEERDQALRTIVENLTRDTPPLQPLVPCAATRSAKEIASIGEACELEGDFLAGILVGHLITVKLTECLNE